MPISATRTFRPQCIRPGSSKCAGLRRKNVTVSVALMAMPITSALDPLTPLGRSTLRTGAPLALMASIIVVGFALDRPVETGAEQRIDDQRGVADRLRVERQHRKLPAPRRGSCVALQMIPLAQQNDRHLAAARGEFGGSHKTIAAIVAGAGDHHDRPLLHQIHRGLGHGLAGAEHQRKSRRARGNGQPIGTLHLG